MEPTSAEPGWLLASILLGFPIMFLGIWSFVCAILAVGSGYRSLADFRIEHAAADEGEKLPTPWYAMIGWVSYRGGLLTLRSSRGGLTLRVPRIFPFHQPIRVPWDRIQEADGGGLLGRLGSGSMLLDGRVRLRVPAETLAAIREAQARHAG
jgi:hypothetical protein